MATKLLTPALLVCFCGILASACASGPAAGGAEDPVEERVAPGDEPAAEAEQGDSADEPARFDESDPLCGHAGLPDVGEKVVSAYFNHNGKKLSLTPDEVTRLGSVLRATGLGDVPMLPPGWQAKLVVETESGCAVELAYVPGTLLVDARYPTDNDIPDVFAFGLPMDAPVSDHGFEPDMWLMELHEKYLGPPTEWRE